MEPINTRITLHKLDSIWITSLSAGNSICNIVCGWVVGWVGGCVCNVDVIIILMFLINRDDTCIHK